VSSRRLQLRVGHNGPLVSNGTKHFSVHGKEVTGGLNANTGATCVISDAIQ
jgi:hypothetical protein